MGVEREGKEGEGARGMVAESGEREGVEVGDVGLAARPAEGGRE